MSNFCRTSVRWIPPLRPRLRRTRRSPPRP